MLNIVFSSIVFFFNLFCLIAAMYDLVHDVETIDGLC